MYPKYHPFAGQEEKHQVVGFAAIESKWHDSRTMTFLFLNNPATHTVFQGPMAVPKQAKLLNYQHSALLRSSDTTTGLSNSEQMCVLSLFSILALCHVA